MKTFVIGDIHGGLKALPQVLKKAKITIEDTLIFLGDYVDGWSESAQVIDFLIELNKKHECIFIKGNHDLWCEDWLRTGKGEVIWLAHGGEETQKSYESYSEEQKQKHLAFFQQMKPYYIDNKNRLFIHAGFTSMHGVEKETFKLNYHFDRTLWETALATDKNLSKKSELYPERFTHYSEIYIGHTPTIRYNSSNPINALNLWNIDTGAAFTGCLTIMDVDSKEFWQSNPIKTLYPNEKGRN
ncbi:metallophosphoesterase family protein [Tenacibaculum singaporense]|uniref:Serine/threonine protein phosphatase n=1 Tax=Tenacibaculum singaporense TaxID=2358479 RepID=A0A3Q8RSV2_9FLAO|nr:metallophosphoesterase family protein [Tenacibaculum singaporense]AZJ36763.1 serine/threonine protein phosphatase [Tenacibaculum singaporense]